MFRGIVGNVYELFCLQEAMDGSSGSCRKRPSPLKELGIRWRYTESLAQDRKLRQCNNFDSYAGVDLPSIRRSQAGEL
jgi:hypothetical protein